MGNRNGLREAHPSGALLEGLRYPRYGLLSGEAFEEVVLTTGAAPKLFNSTTDGNSTRAPGATTSTSMNRKATCTEGSGASGRGRCISRPKGSSVGITIDSGPRNVPPEPKAKSVETRKKHLQKLKAS